jgi:hypothetical protein
VNGTVASPGLVGPIAGTALLVGPYPSINVTTVPFSDGRFSVRVAPGAYAIYANGSGEAAGTATFANALALPSARTPVALTLGSTWTATLSAAAPSGPVGNVSPATFVVQGPLGQRVVFANVPLSARITVPLPAGSYSVRATASGWLYGTTVALSGSAPLRLVRGNGAADIVLSYPTSYAVQGTLRGPSTVTVNSGATVSFAFSVRAIGTTPVTVYPKGTPSYWTFNFSFPNVTLTPGPSGTNFTGEVFVHVPAGTAVAHPGIAIEFALANGTVVGSVAPVPTIVVTPSYGVGIGTTPSLSSQVGADHVLQPFYVVDSGNAAETVALSVVNAAHLATLGWNSTVVNPAKSPITSSTLSAGENTTFFVSLNATAPVFLPPGAVTVSALVLNASGSVSASTTISIPFATVHPSVPPSVTGPSLGTPSAFPDWLVPVLVFVPAIGLAIAIVTYRWWRTRRWRRR